jgi:hypothetical protein
MSAPRVLPKRGFSLIEAAIVLGVVGLVMGGLWVAYSAVRDRMMASEATESLQTITEHLRSLPASFYLTSDQLINWTTGQGVGLSMGVVPQKWVRNGRAVHVYGDYLGIDYDASARNFQIIFQGKGLTPRQCNNLLPELAYDMELSGTISPSGHSWNSARTMAELQAACSGEHAGGGMTMYIQIPVKPN